jgi:hypothetical protein
MALPPRFLKRITHSELLNSRRFRARPRRPRPHAASRVTPGNDATTLFLRFLLPFTNAFLGQPIDGTQRNPLMKDVIIADTDASVIAMTTHLSVIDPDRS